MLPDDVSLPRLLPSLAKAEEEAVISPLSGDAVEDRRGEGQQPLKILMLEDSVTDAELMTRALSNAGLDFTARRVDTREGFTDALETFVPDVVLLDIKIPGYSGEEALAHERRVHPEIPVVIVTGTIGDEAAINLLKAGAKDYVLKSNPVRLPFAVERVIAMERGIRARKAAERAVRESEAKFRSLVEQNVAGIAIVRENGAIAYANPYLAHLIGYTSPELIGRPLLDFVPADARQAVVEQLAAQLSGDAQFVQHQSAIKAKDGRQIAVLINATRSTFEGRPASVAVVIDITERQRAERELALNLAVLATEHDVSPDGILVVDPGDRMISFNRKFVDMWGVPDEILASKSNTRAMQSVLEKLKDPDFLLKTVDHLLSHPEAEVHDELALIDGRTFERYSASMPRPEGGYFGRVFYFRDITERKQAENASREAEAKFRSLVEQNVAGIFIIREDGTIGYVNPIFASILGGVPSDLIGRPLLDFIPDDSRPDVREQLGEHLKSQLSGDGCLMQRESFMRTRDGRTIEVLVNASRSIFEGHPASLAVVLDITESNKAQRDLAANAAILATEHELSPDGILVVDAGAEIISANHRFTDIFGIPAQLIADKRDQPLLEWVTSQIADSAAFLSRVHYLYDHPEESSHEEIILTDGRVLDRHTAPMKRPGGSYLGRIWFFRDITEQRTAEHTLRRLNRALRTLSAGNEALVHAASEPELLKETCRIVVDIGGYRMAWIGTPQQDAVKSIAPIVWAGASEEYLKNVQATWANEPSRQTPHGRAIGSGEPQVIQNVAIEVDSPVWREAALRSGFASSAILPLKDESGGVFAVLTIDAAEASAFDAEELELLQELANDLAFGLRSLRDRKAHETLDQRWRASLEATVGAIAGTVEMRDAYTAGHQRRVAQLAVAVARRLAMSDNDIQGIYLAGIIHDVGKITVPAEILSKPGKLSKLEFQLIQQHAQAGYDIVKGVDFPWPIAQMVLQHHERLDGSGYPQGLKGDAMLPQAKILAVADVVEAMMSHRPYRPALGIAAALAEIEKGKGTLFDPAAVDACLALFHIDGFRFD